MTFAEFFQWLFGKKAPKPPEQPQGSQRSKVLTEKKCKITGERTLPLDMLAGNWKLTPPVVRREKLVAGPLPSQNQPRQQDSIPQSTHLGVAGPSKPRKHQHKSRQTNQKAKVINNYKSNEEKPSWMKRGWKQVKPGRWVGRYTLGKRTWRGEAQKMGTRRGLSFFIFNPPPKVREHPCFIPKGRGCYFVHLVIGNELVSVGLGIHEVERIVRSIIHETERHMRR